MPDVAPLPHAKIEHRIPGRMRLRIHTRRRDAGFFERAVAFLAGEPGVRTVRANPHTASLLVEYEGDGTALLAAAEGHGLFEVAVPAPGRTVAVGAPPSLPGSTGPKVPSPLDLAAAGLAGAGLLQLLRGQVVGSASENLWNAYGLYAAKRQAFPSTLLVAFGLFQIARGEVLGSATSLFLYAFSARRMARHRAVEDTI